MKSTRAQVVEPVDRPSDSARDSRQIRLTIDSELGNTALVSRAVSRLASVAGFGEKDCSQVSLCIAEAVNNSIRHAYHGVQGHNVEAVFRLESDRIVLSVIDTGTPMREMPKLSLDFDPEELASVPEGGMGLFIIQAVMDEMNYRSEAGCNTLTMTKFLRDRPGIPVEK